MPLFASQLSINTQHESSWDTYIKDSHATSNFAGEVNVQCGYIVGRGGTTIKRAILAFDLSDLANRNITSCTLTMKTTSGFGLSGSTDCNIHLLNVADSDIVYDEVTWNESKSGTSWSAAGGDIAAQASGTFTTPWAQSGLVQFTSTDITNLIKSKAGGMAFVLIKTTESSGTNVRSVTGHDEDRLLFPIFRH